MKRSSRKIRNREINVAILSRAVYPFHGYGGLEKHVYHQIKHLSQSGCKVILLTEKPRGIYSPYIEETFQDTDIHFVKKRLFPLPQKRGFIILDRIINYPRLVMSMARTLINYINEGTIDIIYAHGLTGWGITKLRKKLNLEIPIVLNPHGMEEFKNINILKKIMYASFRKKMLYAAENSDRLVATDKVMISQVTGLLKVNKEKVSLLPNAIDIVESIGFINKNINEHLRKRYKIDKDELLFLSVGRLEANKGFNNLIDQLARVENKIKRPWKLLIVGTGSMRTPIEEKIAECNLLGKALLTGSIIDSDLHNLYDLADIFILPSLYEGSSITTIEAMVHKKPIIANRIGGLPDKVQTGINGILCDPGIPDELGDAIVKLSLASKDQLRQMGIKSSKIAKRNFSWQIVAEQSVKLFNQLLSS